MHEFRELHVVIHCTLQATSEGFFSLDLIRMDFFFFLFILFYPVRSCHAHHLSLPFVRCITANCFSSHQ